MTQKEIFIAKEADNWFRRNRAQLRPGSIEVSWLGEQLLPFSDTINAILEIGCGNGEKIRELSKRLSAQGSGIDPSAAAISAGMEIGGANLSVGTADQLNYRDGQFDLVYFAFCLYLVDRSLLMRCIAEADRVLKPGGFLAITDFDPQFPHKRPYHHMPGLFSFKEDYSKYFLNNGRYSLCAKQSYSHRQVHFDLDGNERVATSLLYKEPDFDLLPS